MAVAISARRPPNGRLFQRAHPSHPGSGPLTEKESASVCSCAVLLASRRQSVVLLGRWRDILVS